VIGQERPSARWPSPPTITSSAARTRQRRVSGSSRVEPSSHRPTGCGKTTSRALAEFLDVPFAWPTRPSTPRRLLRQGRGGDDRRVAAQLRPERRGGPAGHRVHRRGGQIARRTHSARTGAGRRESAAKGAAGLLKLLEGREIFVPQNLTQHWNKHDFTPVDTQDILFIAAGTFTDLRLYQENRTVGSAAPTAMTVARRPSRRRSCSITACWPSFSAGFPCGSS